MFDPNQFLDMQVTDANSTQSVPVPEGEYTALIEEVKPRSWQSKDGATSGLALDIQWYVDDASLQALLERKKILVKQGIMLDLTDAGSLDMGKGKNVGLGRLRDAVGLNVPGQPFSFNQLKGRVAKISVKHRIDGDNIYAEVKGVAKQA